jgi:hypothetical protein
VPLSSDIASGQFIRATDEDVIREERAFIERLKVHSNYVSEPYIQPAPGTGRKAAGG